MPAWEAANPPLAKIFFAIPYLNTATDGANDRGAFSFMTVYNRANPIRDLSHARMFNLLFLAIAIFAIAAFARELGENVAIVAIVLLACLPPLLGCAGNVGTDLCGAATLAFAVWATDEWLRRGSWSRAALAGLAAGLGALGKISFIVFFPLCLVILIWRARGRAARAPQVAAFLLAAFVTLWAGYRFELRPLGDFQSFTMPSAESLPSPLRTLYTRMPVPATSYFGAMFMARRYSEVGSLTYFLGRTTRNGFWYYFPCIFFFKTPLPFLILIAIGAARVPLKFSLIPLSLMLSTLNSTIQIGVRHILSVYLFAAIIAAAGTVWLWQRNRTIVIALLAWFVLNTSFAHPDYLAWFNEAAGQHPERIATDSNLDWGQDMLRLAKLTRQRRLESISLRCVSVFPFERYGVPYEPLPAFTVTRGWVAVSETILALDADARRGGFDWLKRWPYERVGTSIRLYHVPENVIPSVSEGSGGVGGAEIPISCAARPARPLAPARGDSLSGGS